MVLTVLSAKPVQFAWQGFLLLQLPLLFTGGLEFLYLSQAAAG
jgi:hypothetical protein